ncbi:MAG: glycine--tRNA ligase subunit beta [Pelagibacteraceae bacterium BACL20 MAG-120920-bin64]|jgi:glycyl-tRNA synthetase beta chain|uniref:glycine--tRNA ligase subunit beta n=1 Tax=Candidatus Pelagibacter sp. TaxID=2024849 RepID=UPI0007123190|nr:MAG: glycine--tRNA ligase subunit beta [Pelagibacteraceae bacterium BACL20 MAG-120920-bin64]
MSEFFLELFSEEIPAGLQRNSRKTLLESFQKLFEEKQISFKKSSSFSTPNRLVILFEGLSKEIIQKAEEIKGPNINAPEKAVEGFLRSNQIDKKDLIKKKIEKGEFYFFKKPSNKINTIDLLEEYTPLILDKLQWKKSMRWGSHSLNWARPLKSILAVFDDKSLGFKFHHLICSNTTFIDKEFEDKKKIFKTFKSYKDFFNQSGIIIDHVPRKEFIVKEIEKISKKNNFIIEPNNKLLDEVTDIVEQPNVIVCKFDQKFLNIPKEILIITMQHHQKYFPTFDKKGKITNEFLVVANNKDTKGYIKLGNERVVEARLSDAQFFWEKNKSQNLVKQVSKLKTMNYFKGLGSYFDKIQRMRKLGGMISDELLISKDQVELSASICKVDLISDLVGEFPELQGIMGGYFAEEQGFDKEIVLAVSEHYLPAGLDSKTPKKPFSIALALTDKIDTLVGFFGINQKPTSSKDPYALRRSALGIIKLLIDNNKEFKIKDLISYSTSLHRDQGFELLNELSQRELADFLKDRLKYYMKEKKIRADIIEASINAYSIDHMNKIYNKASTLNSVINKDIGEDIIANYKRASNILDSELKNSDVELSNTTDPGIFKNDYEKNLFKKINEMRKYFTNINKDENYKESLTILAGAKKVISDFFDNVKVNDEDKNIKKNRLELLQMLCRTFNNYINFSKIETK